MTKVHPEEKTVDVHYLQAVPTTDKGQHYEGAWRLWTLPRQKNSTGPKNPAYTDLQLPFRCIITIRVAYTGTLTQGLHLSENTLLQLLHHKDGEHPCQRADTTELMKRPVLSFKTSKCSP